MALYLSPRCRVALLEAGSLYAAHPSRAAPHDRLDYLDVACAVRVHNAAAACTPPVDEGQPPQGEAAAARQVKEPGLFLAVERRALAAARDGHLDVCPGRDGRAEWAAADLAAQLEVCPGRQVD